VVVSVVKSDTKSPQPPLRQALCRNQK